MKKNWLKRAGCMVMALVLSLGGLTACGGGDPYENKELAKEHVYRYQELNLPELGGDDSSMSASFYVDGKLYLIMQVYHWEDMTGNQREYKLISMNEDGSGVQMADLEMPKVVLSPEELSGEDASGDQTEGEDSAQQDEPAAAEEEDPEEEADTDVDVDDGIWVDDDFMVDSDFEMDYYEPEIYEYAYLYNLILSENGVFGLNNYSYRDYSQDLYISRVYICKWNLDGSLIWSTDLGNLETEEEYYWPMDIIASPDGSVSLLLSGMDYYSQDISADGVLGERVPLADTASQLFERYSYIMRKSNGKMLVVTYSEDNWQEQYMVEYDPATNTASDPVQVPGTVLYSNYGMSAGSISDVIYPTSSGVYVYNRGDEAGREIMNYINSDVNISSMESVIELNDTQFVGFFYENYNYGEIKAGLFTYVPPEEVPDKKVLVLACYYAGSDIKQRVVDFNRTSQEYKIVIKNYDIYNTYDDYQAGVTQLNNDIITGNMPDILVANTDLPVSNYIAKGLLADIGKMIEDDEELSKEEFLQNVFDAYSVKGKLYYVIPTFYVRTMLAKTRLVGDGDRWTMDEMIQVLDSMPEGTNLISDMTRSYFFNLVMQYCGSNFVDVDTGKCNFNSPDFIAMMEFAKSLPEEITYDEDYWMNYNWETMYREDRALLYEAYISRIADLNYVINGYFGEDVNFIGFPMEGGKGSVLYAGNSYCISAKSGNKDGAWEFLRYYLTDEYQESLTYGLPVQKDVFVEKAQEARNKPYYIDGDGNKQEYDETFWMNGESIPLDPMTQEQIDQVTNAVYSVDRVYYYNTDVMNIINEEMDYFFQDQKTAEDVAETIQRRVQVYVDENS